MSIQCHEFEKRRQQKKSRTYRERHAEEIRTKAREMRKLKADEIRKYKLEYRKLNIDKIKNTQRKYNELNADHLKQKAHELYEKKKSQILERHRKNKRAVDPLKRKQIVRDYGKKRRMDPTFRMINSCRERMRDALKRNTKSVKTIALLGYPIVALRYHIEAQFEPGMYWNNYGKWHVDHIVPCRKFDMTKEEDQYVCFNWRNLQPMWGEQNIIKGDNPCIPSLKKLIVLLEANHVEEDRVIVARLLAVARLMCLPSSQAQRSDPNCSMWNICGTSLAEPDRMILVQPLA